MTGEPEQAVFAALADPTRRALLRSIASGEATTPTELAARLPVSRQAVRKHLALLEQARLVDAERSGREVHFQATPAPLGDAIAWMTACRSTDFSRCSSSFSFSAPRLVRGIVAMVKPSVASQQK